MNLRKFTARTIAIASCAAMLSTNVFAAQKAITAAGVDGKLKVTIGGDAGQTTFLAVDAGTNLASVTGDKIQYIEQDAKTADANLVYTFTKRANGASKVDLYSGGEDVESYAVEQGIAIEATAVAKIKDIYETPFIYEAATANDFATKTEAQLKEILNCKMGVDYTAIGAKEATYIDMDTSENADDFVLGTPTTTDNEIYTVTVKYKGIDAGSITVKEKDPKKATAISVSGGTGKTFYYNTAETEFDDVAAKALLKDSITVTATYDDGSNGTISADDVTYLPVGGSVTIQYNGLAAPETITVTLTKRAITGASTVGSTDTVELTARATDTVDDAFVVAKVKAIAGNFVEYTWNDGGKSYEALADLDVTAQYDEADSDGNTFFVTVSSSKDGASEWFERFKAHVTVKNAFGIKGKVTVADTFGITNSTTFKDAIPVGAVVTAIPKLTAKGYSGNVANTSFGYTSYAAMVDENGDYELELPEGTYNVYVSHTRYVVRNVTATNITVSTFRTLLDAQAKFEVTISENDADLQKYNANLRYAYAGDMNLDGEVNMSDYTTFAGKFGANEVPGIE